MLSIFFFDYADGKDTEEQSHCSPSWSSEGNLKYTLIFILELLPMVISVIHFNEFKIPTPYEAIRTSAYHFNVTL